ncbi:MAG: hypothetical protein K6F99_06260, partial [Lachnospiraceae bacterium]|nr:hypothetical protein [Lachnospiraceae bacterium]
MPGPGEKNFEQKKQQEINTYKTTDDVAYTRPQVNLFENNMQVNKSAKTTDNLKTDENEKEIFKQKLENAVNEHESLQQIWNKAENEFDQEHVQNIEQNKVETADQNTDLKQLQDRMMEFN